MFGVHDSQARNEKWEKDGKKSLKTGNFSICLANAHHRTRLACYRVSFLFSKQCISCLKATRENVLSDNRTLM